MWARSLLGEACEVALQCCLAMRKSTKKPDLEDIQTGLVAYCTSGG